MSQVKSKITKRTADLLYAATEHSPEMLYLARMFVPDPFIAMRIGKRTIGVFPQLEISRAYKQSAFNKILSLEECRMKAADRFPKLKITTAEIIAYLAETLGVSHFVIPDSFPAGLAMRLGKLKIKVEVRNSPFFPEQMVKSVDELTELKKANRVTAAALARAEAMLQASSIVGRKLMLEGKPLTSERVRMALEITALEQGARMECIVAGGEQACDPHSLGEGPLRPNELIIVDVFPRLKSSGYYGDMSRTFLKGKASELQKSLIAAVSRAQKQAIAATRAGVDGEAVHRAAVTVFDEMGYSTGVKAGVPYGFIHSTGHGVGLGLHEPIRVAPGGPKLSVGNVITIEPGLYYPGLGGVRIEDVVAVTKTGTQKLSSYHYAWQIA